GAAHSCRGQPCAGVAVTDVRCTDRIGSTTLRQPHRADHTGNEPGWRTPRVASPDGVKHRFAFRHERQLVTLAAHYTIATACNLVSVSHTAGTHDCQHHPVRRMRVRPTTMAWCVKPLHVDPDPMHRTTHTCQKNPCPAGFSSPSRSFCWPSICGWRSAAWASCSKRYKTAWACRPAWPGS